ncbi:MAG: carbohydrate ABC transporter permease [Rectinemataceae bacterium]
MKRRLARLLAYFAVALMAAVWLLPVLSTVFVALKTPKDFVSQRLFALPAALGLISNFAQAMEQYGIQNHALASLLYSAAGTAAAILFASAAGYSIVRLRPRFNFALFMLIYAGTIFPFQMYLIPVYKLYNAVGLYDTRFGMILIYSAICIPFALFVYRGFYTTIPREIEEAAKLDGCGPLRMLFAVFIPNSAAPTAVVALFQSTWIWNDLLFGMVLTRSDRTRPIMVAVSSMMGFGGTSIPMLMTAVLAVSVPTVAVFVFLGRFFISGMVMAKSDE